MSRGGRPLILVLGMRRTGKTGLVKSCLNELNYPHVVVDLKGFWGSPGSSLREFYAVLEESINQFLGKWRKLINYLKHVEGISIHGFSVKLRTEGRRRFSFISFLHRLNDVGRDFGRAVLVFDEAQLFHNINGLNIVQYVSYAYDNLRNLVVVMTGSEIGLLYDLLRVDDPDSPLYGRYVYEVRTKRFSRDESIEFLKKGFNEYGLRVPDPIIEEAVDLLDGIPGWLTLYGSTYVSSRSTDVIHRVLERASQIVRKELEKFLITRGIARKRYVTVLKLLAEQPASWSEIKRSVEYMERKRISDKSLYNILQNLTKTGMIEKKNGKYHIADPILKYTVKQYQYVDNQK